MIRLSFFAATIAAVAESCRLLPMPAHYGQIEQESGEATCMTTAERARKSVKNFYEIVDGKNRIEDKEFPHNQSSLYWANLGEADGKIGTLEKSSNISWRRAFDAYPNTNLFGDGLHPQDLDEIFTGNNWFVSAIGAVAEFPGRIEKMFLNTQNRHSAGGIYAV